MIRHTALVIVSLACSTVPAQIRPEIDSPATVTGGLERAVTGAPFSAESVTEFFQTASDGSHVKQETTAVVARDSNGRTRYSQTLLPILPGGSRIITIVRDPVAGVRYWMDSREKVARRELIRSPVSERQTKALEERNIRARERGGAMLEVQSESPLEAAIKVARQSVARAVSGHGNGDLARNIQPETKGLGDRTIEGVAAVGARVLAVIPAGQIGNEKPLTVTSEAWYSSELRIIVMSKVSDPVTGDTTFQLTHLRRGEPSSDLFEVPAGYRLRGPGVSSEPGLQRGKD